MKLFGLGEIGFIQLDALHKDTVPMCSAVLLWMVQLQDDFGDCEAIRVEKREP